jgi:glyoxylase-like metal-dependent hydrolase (beta-lactamase superfamily II)
MKDVIETLDVRHEGKPGIIAVYVIRHADGAVLVDCGPGSTVPTLVKELAGHGLTTRDITDVLLTHIHLDHGGSAGWWAGQGARVHVHPVGAPHLLNPDKLLASARRIYGEDMERLWGDFLATPQDRLIQHGDGDVIKIGGWEFVALETPGHAEHHFAYLFGDVCFTGDVGGVRVGGLRHVRAPTPPPEIHFDKWRASLGRLRVTGARRIAPTHFGIYDDMGWQLDALERSLDATERWTERAMRDDPPPDLFRTRFAGLLDELARGDGYEPAQAAAFADAAGTDMTADGVYRFWTKYRATPTGQGQAR